MPHEAIRYLSISQFRRLIEEKLGEDHVPTERTVQRWCESGRLPARKLTSPRGKHDSVHWVIDLRKWKSADDREREFYELLHMNAEIFDVGGD